MTKLTQINLDKKLEICFMNKIASMGGFDDWLDLNQVVSSVSRKFPTISKTYLRRFYYKKFKPKYITFLQEVIY